MTKTAAAGWKWALLSLILILSMQPLCTVAQEADAMSPADPYLINPGDYLSISVWKEADLQRGVIVRPDGAFSFPLTGDIQAAGRSVEEVRQTLTDRLQKYIPDPVVTVATEDLRGSRIYVIGEVQRPGEFPVNRSVDVMQALSMAAGMTPFANSKDIKILRRINKKLIAIPFNYEDVKNGKRLNQNIRLEPGDVVVIP